MSSTTAPADPAATPQEFDARAQAAWERWLRVVDTVNLHAALFADRSPTQRLAGTITGIDSTWQKLRAMPDVNAASTSLLTTVENDLRGVETETLKADAAIPTAMFRQSFSEKKAGYEILIRYVQLLVSKLDSTDRRDRVEFLATRLLSTATGDGHGKVLSPRASIDSVLRAICVGREVKADVRANAVKHFEEAIRKAQSLTSVDEAFDGGLLLDVRGFKLSLGHDLIEPDVLYAAVAFNVEIGNRLDLLMKEEGLQPGALAERNARLDKKLAEIFKEQRSFSVPAPQKFVAVKKAPEKPTKWTRPVEREASSGSRLRIIAAVGLMLLVLAGRIAWSFIDFGPSLTPMTDYQAAALSPYFAHASNASYDGDPGIDAELTTAIGWTALTPDQKHAKAGELVGHLYTKNVFRGVVWTPGHASKAIVFRGGSVLSVE